MVNETPLAHIKENKMNTIQKISLIVAAVTFVFWVASAYDSGFELFDPEWWDLGFKEWYLQVSFALFIGYTFS